MQIRVAHGQPGVCNLVKQSKPSIRTVYIKSENSSTIRNTETLGKYHQRFKLQLYVAN